MTLIGITVRSWLYAGSCALENMVLGMEEQAVRDGGNHLSTDEFDACLAIVVCRIGSNTFAHLGQIVGLYRGDARQIWDRSKDCGPSEGETYEMKPLTRIHRVPDEVCGPIEEEGVHADHRAAVVHYLLDMG